MKSKSDLNLVSDESDDSVLNQMLARAYSVKSEYERLKDELDRLNEGILTLCKFDNSNSTINSTSCRSVSFDSEDYRVNIIKRSTVVYDQKLLVKALDMMDGEDARDILKVELKPRTRDALEDYIKSNFNEISDILIRSRIFKDSKPIIRIIKR